MAEGEAPELTTAEKLHAQEVAERTLLGSPGGGPTAAEVTEMRDKNRLGRWREVVKGLSGDAQTTAAELRFLVDHKFGIERNPATGQKTHPASEGTRHPDAQTAIKVYLPLLDTIDFDQIQDPNQQTALVNELVTALERSHMSTHFHTLTDLEKGEAATEMLRNQRLKKTLVDILKPIIKRDLVPDDAFHEADKNTAVSQSEQRSAILKRNWSNDDLSWIQQKVSGIMQNPPNPILGARARALSTSISGLSTEMGQLETKADGIRQALDRMRPAVVQNQTQNSRGRGGGTTTATTHVVNPAHELRAQNLEKELASVTQRQMQIQQEISNLTRSYTDIIPTEELVIREREAVGERISETDKARVEANMDVTGNQNKRHDLAQQRTLQEEQIVTLLRGALSEALEQFVPGELERLNEEKMKDMLEKKKDGLDDARKACMRDIQTRWKQDVNRKEGIFTRRKNKFLVSRDRIRQEYDMLESQGVDHYMQHAFAALPEMASLDQKDRDNILQDVEMQKAIITPLLYYYKKFNGLDENQINNLMDMPVVADQIGAAIQRDAKYNKYLADLGLDANVRNPNFRKEFSRLAARHPRLLFFPLTGIPMALWYLIFETPWNMRQGNQRTRASYGQAA